MWRLIYGIPSWFLFMALDVPLMLLGWILIPLAAACGAYYEQFDSDNVKFKVHFTWSIMWLWDNPEDGIANNSYNKVESMFWRIVLWSALRNPVNNLRNVPFLNVKIDPARIGFCGSIIDYDSTTRIHLSDLFKIEVSQYDKPWPQWFFAWQGFYTTFYWQFWLFGKLKRFWIGWKIYPTDIYGVTEYRKNGAGFSLQFKNVIPDAI